jgi:hypothetical protein
MSNISINKKQLEDYLSDFHPNKKEEVLKRFENFNFDCGEFSFRSKMKRIISMPKFGKRTLIYWISRGWSKDDAFNKRIPDNKDPETSPMNIIFWINKGLTKEEAEIKVKSQRKFNKEYWIKEGFSEFESIEKVKDFQRENSEKLQIKMKNDENFRNDVNSKKSNNINYWLNKGLSLSEAELKLSERQSTFSLKKCIEKHGDKIGKEIWDNRQEKWIRSLSLSKYNGRDNKDSKTIESFKNKYGTNWIEPYLNQICFKDREEILYLTSFENYKKMIDNLVNDKYKLGDISYFLKYKILEEVYNTSRLDMLDYLTNNYEFNHNTPEYYQKYYENWIDKFIEENSFKDKEEVKFLLSFSNYEDLINYMIENYRITDIIMYLKSKLISFYYKTSFRDMFKYLTNKNPYIKSKFGRMRYFNNHLCRSDGEFIIAKFLLDNNIEYQYEKRYKDSLKRCDFYLTKYDFYIEYTGMSNIESCKIKYEKKEEFCLKNGLSCIFSSNIEEIKNKIKEIYENKSYIRQVK